MRGPNLLELTKRYNLCVGSPNFPMLRKYANLFHQGGIRHQSFHQIHISFQLNELLNGVFRCAPAGFFMCQSSSSHDSTMKIHMYMYITYTIYVHIYIYTCISYCSAYMESGFPLPKVTGEIPKFRTMASLYSTLAQPCSTPLRLKLASTKADAMVGGPSSIMPSIQDRLCHMW